MDAVGDRNRHLRSPDTRDVRWIRHRPTGHRALDAALHRSRLEPPHRSPAPRDQVPAEACPPGRRTHHLSPRSSRWVSPARTSTSSWLIVLVGLCRPAHQLEMALAVGADGLSSKVGARRWGLGRRPHRAFSDGCRGPAPVSPHPARPGASEPNGWRLVRILMRGLPAPTRGERVA